MDETSVVWVVDKFWRHESGKLRHDYGMSYVVGGFRTEGEARNWIEQIAVAKCAEHGLEPEPCSCEHEFVWDPVASTYYNQNQYEAEAAETYYRLWRVVL